MINRAVHSDNSLKAADFTVDCPHHKAEVQVDKQVCYIRWCGWLGQWLGAMKGEMTLLSGPAGDLAARLTKWLLFSSETQQF